MRRAAEMVFGSLPDVRHVCLSEDKGIAQFEAELSAVFEELPGGEPVAVLCDVNEDRLTTRPCGFWSRWDALRRPAWCRV